MIRSAFVALSLCASPLFAQDDLLKLLGEEETGPTYATASFKSTRVINGHSLENTARGVLDFRISHRFGYVNSGVDGFWGLDDATIRLGLDYGITDRLMIGIGRSSYQKTVDGFTEYKILRQCTSGCSMPITLSFLATSSITTLQTEQLPWYDPTRTDYFTHRMAYTFQVILGRKFNENLSLQLNPGVVHRNLVGRAEEANDVIHISAAGRFKLTKRLALTTEYFYILPDQIDAKYHNSFSVGVDIETGGHVFQLQFTNSTGMFERSFITETEGQWGKGDIRYGFNISRVFTVAKPKKPKE